MRSSASSRNTPSLPRCGSSPPTAGLSIVCTPPAPPCTRRMRFARCWSPSDVAHTSMAPVTQYADSGGASLAYQVIGEGPIDLLFLPGWISQVEQIWELPSLRRFFERLAAIGRVIQFDRRGTGLSDRVVGAHSLEQEVLDALAVLDAAGSER